MEKRKIPSELYIGAIAGLILLIYIPVLGIIVAGIAIFVILKIFALSATRVRPVKHCSPFPLISSLTPAQIEKLKDRTVYQKAPNLPHAFLHFFNLSTHGFLREFSPAHRFFRFQQRPVILTLSFA